MKIQLLFIALLLSICSESAVYSQNILSYDLKGKLQTNTVTSIVQDNLGFIWIGHDNGIAKFDGYAAEPLLLQSDSGSVGYINSIQNIDSVLYIATNEGLYVYNYIENKIKVAVKVLLNQNVVSFKYVDGIWYAATNNGLFIFDKNWNLLNRVMEQDGLASDRITCIIVNPDKTIWVGTEYGLDLVTRSEKETSITSILKGRRIAELFIDSSNYLWICYNEEILRASSELLAKQGSKALKSLMQDVEALTFYQNQDQVWIGTRGDGVYQFIIHPDNSVTFEQRLLIDEYKVDDLKNTILTFYEDNYSNVWLGTLNGLYLLKNDKKSPFYSIKYSPKDSNTPSSNIISSIYCDANNMLWLATSNGINKLEWKNKNDYTFKHYLDNRDPSNRISNNKIQTVVGYKENILLVSTKSSVKFFNTQTNVFYDNKELNDSLQSNGMKYVRSSFRDADGNIWLAFSEGGIGVLNKTNDKLYKLKFNRSTNSKHRAINRDRAGNLWVSSDDEGIFCLTLGKNISEVVKSKLYDRNTFGQHWITSLYIDKQNRIWAGTSNGLYKYDTANDEFKPVNFPYFRKEFYVSGIIEDFFSNIWIVGIDGIYKISANESFQYYEPYSTESISKTWYIFGLTINQNGNIFVGGVNGLTYFNPQEVIPDPYTHTLAISGFSILNKPILPDGERLYKDINISERIVLTHGDYQFSLTFSSLFYPDPMKVEYAYMLEGFDEDWIYTDASRRYVSYSNLKPGNYTFKVRSTNTSGIWLDNIKEIDITVKPAPWLTWWAFLIYAVLLSGVIFLVVRVLDLGSKLKYKEALNNWKLNYYINLSYSFKVPLTLIYAPLQNLLKDYESLSEAEVKRMLHTMLHNVKKLSFQISQLLEFRKIDSGKGSLALTEINIITLVKDVYNIFLQEAQSKQINYTFESNVNSVIVIVDTTKIEVALYNILANAVKYTSKGGKIKVTCNLNSSDYKLWISVVDTGHGIDYETQGQILNRFEYTNRNVTDEKEPYSGISLSIASDYIQMHHSEITIDSKIEEGSEFKFYIHLGVAHFTDQELQSLNKNKTEFALPKGYPDVPVPITDISTIDEVDLPLIYLYKGDRDLDYFIKSSLYKKYNVTIVDGDFDLDNLRGRIPSLIIIDLAYDDDSKFILCKKIKEHAFLSSIPVIFISSLSTDEDKQKAYEMGVDAYITKPFDIFYLRTRIKQLLESRNTIKEKVKKELIVNPKEVVVTSDDDIFLANIMNTLEKHISNTEFNIDDLSNELNISRSMLYRRLSQLTNKPPVEFIKEVRLKRAANLLEITSYNISEISIMVGFSDQRYFSSCFKKQYGVTPKKYSLNMKQKNANE